jgi:ankyrin repeat protein
MKTKLGRGAPLLEAIAKKLAKKVGKPKPLDEKQIRACEDAAGVALSPSLYALLAFDAGMMKRDFRWFDAKMKLAARPAIDVIREHAGALGQMYEQICEARLSGKALELDAGSDSMRFLYFGDPDELGEYPVLFIDHDDMPILGVEYPGFDGWLADLLGIPGKEWSKGKEARCKAMLGVELWDIQEEPGDYPEPVPAPAPGSIAREAVAKKKEKKLTATQLAKALAEAAEEGDAEAVRTLAPSAKKKALDDALVLSARSGNTDTMRALLEAGASAKARGYYGCTLSAMMDQPNALELAKLLLDAGADPNGPSVNGETVMHDAVETGSLELVKLLLEAGGDPNHEDKNGMTPLHVASTRPVQGAPAPPEMIDLLVEHGAKVDGGSSHSTALQWAIDDGLPDHVARLLAHGAKLGAKTKGIQKRSALHLAYDRGDDAMIRSLIAAGADRTSKDERGISFETIFGEKGEDIRPIDAQYTASEKPQRLTITARMAVLNHVHIANVALQLGTAKWVELLNDGLGAGAEFDPRRSRAKAIESPVWTSIKKNGFTDLRWVLEVASVSPLFLKVIAARIFGGSGAFTGAGILSILRGTSLEIRGSLDPKPVPLREWLADPSVHLGEWKDSLPFAFETASGPSRVLALPKDGKLLEHTGEFHHAFFRWFELAWDWPRAGAGGAILGAPTKKDGGGFPIVGYLPPEGKSTRRWPFTTDAPIVALKNALRVLHEKVPLERVVLTMEK